MSDALLPWHSRNCTKIRCCVAHLPDLAEPIRQTCTQGRFRKVFWGCKKNDLSILCYNPNMQDEGLLGKNSLCMPSTCLCSRVVGAHFLLGICPCGLCCDGWAGQDECSSQGSCGLLCEVLLLQQKQQQCSEAAVLAWDTRRNRAAESVDSHVKDSHGNAAVCANLINLIPAHVPVVVLADVCICSKGQQ